MFPYDALHPAQEDQSASLLAKPEYYHEFEDGSSFTAVPFFRLDSGDRDRTHFDLRELTFLWLHDDFELRVGVRQVFWGVTEVSHLVDIINQDDTVENIDAEDKLGQPMVNLSIARDWGTIDLFLLPYFRERTFPGRGGRLRSALPVDTDQARFESSAEEWHTDWAARYSVVLGDWDIGIYHFMGTGREPTLELSLDDSGDFVLIPFYEQINQTGLDVSFVYEDWLWKLEALHRAGQGPEEFFAITGGFEYTFTGVLETQMDLGLLIEWLWDEREDDAANPFENDVAFGIRLAVNDVASTEILFGWVQDVDTSARSLFVEAGRRFGDNWKLSVEIRAFLDQPESDFLIDLRDDDLAQLELAYYF